MMNNPVDIGRSHSCDDHRWSPSRWRWALLAVGLLALVVRLVYVHEIRQIGFFNVPLSDALVYVQRAQEILQGNWLGPADFIHAPLYAYMLAAVQFAGFESLLAPRMMQAVMGALTCVLVMLIARRAMIGTSRQELIALVAGIMLALHPPAIFFDGLIQKTSTVFLLSAALVWLLLRAGDRSTARWWLACGVMLGLLTLVRQNALALVPLLAVYAWFSASRPRTQRATSLAMMALGMVIVLSPWVIRHKLVLDEFFLSTPNMGQNFAMGNHPDATGTYLPPQRGRSAGEAEHAVWKRDAEQALGRELSADEISDYHLDASLTYIRQNPGQWLQLTGKKLLMVFGAYELPDTEDYYLYKEHSQLLRWGDGLLHFGIIGPLAIGGIVLSATRWRRLWLLYGWLIINALAVAAFVVFARYRAPMLPVLVIFAAIMIVQTWVLVQGRQWRQLVMPMCSVLLAALVMNWPVHSLRQTHAFSYVNHAVALAQQQRYEEALDELDKAHALQPKHVDAHWIRASVHFDLQQFDEAMMHYRAAIAGDESFGGAHRGLGMVLLAVGDTQQAAAHFRMAIELDSMDHIAMNKLAVTHATRGETLQAMSLLEQAAAIAPHDAEVQLNLGNVHLAMQQLPEAVMAYEQALMLRAGYYEAHLNLANVHTALGELDDAITHLRLALAQQPNDRHTVLTLVNLYVRAERSAEAAEFLRRRIATGEADLQPLLDALLAR